MAWRKSGILRKVKNALLPAGSHPRAILTGPFKGIRLEMDLHSEAQIYAGLFERELYPTIRRLTADARTVVDIGAAHGEYTLFALLKTNAERVISIEPDPWMIGALHRNLALNSLEKNNRLEMCAKYVGTTEDENTIAADSLAERIRPPCFLKMDIEGAEGAVLRASSQGLLMASGLRWLIETHSHALRNECEHILKSHGYSTNYIPQAGWRVLLPELRGTEVGWLVATK
jgi:predicted RNA methylase